MLESYPVAIIVGAALGFLAGLGIGGGSLLVLWLTLILGWDPQAARGVNLLFFLPCAVIACFFRWKQGDIPWKRILPGTVIGCVTAGFFSWIGTLLELALLKKLFGALLIITGIRELFYKPKK